MAGVEMPTENPVSSENTIHPLQLQ